MYFGEPKGEGKDEFDLTFLKYDRDSIQQRIIFGALHKRFVPTEYPIVWTSSREGNIAEYTKKKQDRAQYKDAVRRQQIGETDYVAMIENLEKVSFGRTPSASEVFRRLSGSQNVHVSYKQSYSSAENSHYLVGYLLGHPNQPMTEQDIETFMKSPPSQDVFVFEKLMQNYLAANKHQPQKKQAELERTVDYFGKAIFEKKWAYLLEIRYLERAAKAEQIVKEVRPETLRNKAIFELLLPQYKIYLSERYICDNSVGLERIEGTERLVRLYENALRSLTRTDGPLPADLYAINADLIEVIGTGSLDGNKFDERIPIPEMERSRGIFSQIYLSSPEVAREIAKQKIVLGHGTGSASLVGFAKHGLRPQGVLGEKKQHIAGGEGIFGAANINQQNLSTADFFSYSDPQYGNYVFGCQPITIERLEQKIALMEANLESGDFLVGQWNIDQNGGTRLGSLRHSHRITVENAKKTLAFLQKPDKTGAEKLEAGLTLMNFPVLYLIGEDSIKDKKGIQGTMMDDEQLIPGGFAQNEVPIILVPEKYVAITEFVMNWGGLKPKVYPLEYYPFDPYKLNSGVDAV